ncbi:MAG TPA: redoxin domain-containing protein [Bacteroidia bacterium]|nr:redoxin domain-containing protein [Bacteroidia bacterium]
MNLLYKNTLLLFIVFTSSLLNASNQDGHDIKIIVKGFKEGSTCILGFYNWDKKYIKDSAKVGPHGEAIFKGSSKYQQGVYFIYPESKKYFDIIMDEGQHFTLETDTLEYIQNMKVKGSEENMLFFNYQRFISNQEHQAEPLRTELKKIKDKDSVKTISDQLSKIDETVIDYKKNFIREHPKTFIAKLFSSSQDPEIPEAPLLPNGKKDTLFPFRYYKTHFFDHVDFSDERLLYSPVLFPKIKKYMEDLTIQLPDSINVSADYLVEKARNNPEIFKYVVSWLTLNYESSKIMGMDAVFVHMVEKYYVTNQTYWVDSAQLYKIAERAYTLKPILIGKKAPPISMVDSSNNPVSLYDVKGTYTVVIFWDSECGHCQKEVPKLWDLYESKLKSMGIQVYAIATEDKVKEWKKFIIEHKLKWINVHQPNDYQRAVTKKIYDVISTPYIYLLDENKIIKAKHIDVEQLGNLIDAFEKEKLKK